MGRSYVQGGGDGVYTKTRRCCYLVSTDRTTTEDVIREKADKLLALPVKIKNMIYFYVSTG